MQTYTCAMCNGTFESDRSDEDALAETGRNFGKWAETLKPEERTVLCDDCYNQLTINGEL